MGFFHNVSSHVFNYVSQDIDTIVKTLTEAHNNTLFYDAIPAKETKERHAQYLVSKSGEYF